MPKQILAFAASNSKNSINKKLVTLATQCLSNTTVELLDLNDFEMPIYSIDRQENNGIPKEAYLFNESIKRADGIIISFAEHNGIFTAAYKNIYDWVTRIEKNIWRNKPMLLLSTSNGKKGASNVLDFATRMYQHANPNIIESFSLPSFNDNFSEQTGITNKFLSKEFSKKIDFFSKAL